MEKPVLVVMAAGMGSRYGGLKQMDPMDKEGHAILDFSVYDAMLAGFESFIRAERFSSLNEEGKLLSMNVWTDEAAVECWRNVMQHRMSQKEGREKLFESYKITVCSEIRSYTDKDRSQAPQDSNAFFEV